MKLAERPLVWITVAFALGIALAASAPLLVWVLLVATLGLAGLWLISRRALWGNGALLLAFAVAGCVRYAAAVQSRTDNVARMAPAWITIEGVVTSEPRLSPPRFAGAAPRARFVLDVRRVVVLDAQGDGQARFGERLVPVSGSVEARIPLAALMGARQTRSLASASAPVRHTPSTAPFAPGQEPADQSESGADGSEADTAGRATGGLDIPDSDRPHYGDTLRLRGRLELPLGARNPGGFDYAAYLRRRGIVAQFSARRREDWQPATDISAMPNPLLRLAYALRRGVIRHGQRVHDPIRAAVLNGILLGDHDDLPGTLNEDFERTGAAHILATAGLHVGMVLGMLLGGLRLARVPRRPALLLTLFALALYALMAGGRPSVTRAVLMAGVILAGLLLEREPDLPVTLAFAALILLAANPQNLFEPGFQLSFATVACIVALMPFARFALRDWPARIPAHWPGANILRRGAQAVLACFFLALAAQIGAAPLVAYYFNNLSLASLPANTLVVPIVALTLGLGFCAAGLDAIHPTLAWPLDRLLDALLAWIIQTIQACSHLPYASLPVASPPLWLIAAYYAGVALAAHYGQRLLRQKENGEDAEADDAAAGVRS